jgi:hypothetical protein
MDYEIEQVRSDHPGLWTDSFEACAVARCQESGGEPWPLDVHCHALPTAGSGSKAVSLRWSSATAQKAGYVVATYQDERVTEDAAIGLCAASFALLSEGRITEVTQRGQGVDYWVDDRRAVLEVSGLREGSSSDLQRRHHQKKGQLASSSLCRNGKGGYVFVVLFSGREAQFSYHP